MAKHNQQWRDARWKQKERQKTAEKKRRDWETSEQEQQTKHLLRELRKFTIVWRKAPSFSYGDISHKQASRGRAGHARTYTLGETM